jgi:hypothetical protein
MNYKDIKENSIYTITDGEVKMYILVKEKYDNHILAIYFIAKSSYAALYKHE